MGAISRWLPSSTRSVAVHPLRERLCGQRMLALSRCGRQAEALRAGADIRHRLVEELGVEPGPALRAVEATVLAQRWDLDPARGGAPRSRQHRVRRSPGPVHEDVGRGEHRVQRGRRGSSRPHHHPGFHEPSRRLVGALVRPIGTALERLRAADRVRQARRRIVRPAALTATASTGWRTQGQCSTPSVRRVPVYSACRRVGRSRSSSPRRIRSACSHSSCTGRLPEPVERGLHDRHADRRS